MNDNFTLCSMVAGNLLVVSTHSKEIHEEVHSYQCLDCCIVDMAYCASLNKAGAGINKHSSTALITQRCLEQSCCSRIDNEKH